MGQGGPLPSGIANGFIPAGPVAGLHYIGSPLPVELWWAPIFGPLACGGMGHGTGWQWVTETALS